MKTSITFLLKKLHVLLKLMLLKVDPNQLEVGLYQCYDCNIHCLKKKKLRGKSSGRGSHNDMVCIYVPAFWDAFSQNLV